MPATKTTRAVAHPAEGFRAAVLNGVPNRPVRVYLPTDYQPKYAYPLVVLFHAEGECEEHAARLVPRLSRRNYIVLCLRGSVDLGLHADGRPAFGWADGAPDRGTKAAIAYVMARFSVHTERVFLVGSGEGVGAAYQLGLAMGDRIAGVVALNGRLPKGRVPANNLNVLIGHGTSNSVIPVGEARRAATVLARAGATVRVTRYATSHRVHPEMLSDANKWIMSQVMDKTVFGV